MPPDPRPPARIVDSDGVRRARLAGDECAACGGEPGSAHHVVQRGAPHHGDDVPDNIVLLCGSGTSGCHGAWHGNPYTRILGPSARSITRWGAFEERRDRDWVARRTGDYLLRRRPDVLAYVLGKLEVGAGLAFLEREYLLDPAEVSARLARVPA